MRHAKSDWSGGHDDHARPLNKRGRRTAPRVAAHLASIGWAPDVVISSDAARTRETWAGMSATFPEVEPTFTRSLYLSGPAEIVDCVCRLPPEVGTALVLGHNPGWSFACHWLAGADVDMKTADAALLEIDDDEWPSAATRHDWTFVELVCARSLEDG